MVAPALGRSDDLALRLAAACALKSLSTGDDGEPSDWVRSRRRIDPSNDPLRRNATSAAAPKPYECRREWPIWLDSPGEGWLRYEGGSSNGDPAVEDDAEPADDVGDGSGLSDASIGGKSVGDGPGDGRSVGSGHGSSNPPTASSSIGGGERSWACDCATKA